MNIQEELTRSQFRVAAAQSFLDGTVKEFEAALMVGSPVEREKARLAVIAAMEALLDKREENARVFLKAQGINPDTRG